MVGDDNYAGPSADLYVGLKSDKVFVQQGEPLVVQSIVTDLDGKAIAGRVVKMRAALLDWQQVKGEWKQVETNHRSVRFNLRLTPSNAPFNRKKADSIE